MKGPAMKGDSVLADGVLENIADEIRHTEKLIEHLQDDILVQKLCIRDLKRRRACLQSVLNAYPKQEGGKAANVKPH
jgi:hypothetical protein